jgi:hypothetical protein
MKGALLPPRLVSPTAAGANRRRAPVGIAAGALLLFPLVRRVHGLICISVVPMAAVVALGRQLLVWTRRGSHHADSWDGDG